MEAFIDTGRNRCYIQTVFGETLRDCQTYMRGEQARERSGGNRSELIGSVLEITRAQVVTYSLGEIPC